jgi:hypothetical protein
MSLKFFFFLIRTWIFSENLGAVCKEQGERLYKGTKEMERRCQGWENVKLMGDYYWTLHYEIPKTSHTKNSKIRNSACK